MTTDDTHPAPLTAARRGEYLRVAESVTTEAGREHLRSLIEYQHQNADLALVPVLAIEREAAERARTADPSGLREAIGHIKSLIEAGDDIRCYPSGAVGFDEWYEARDAAQLNIGQWVDEEGDWRDIATSPSGERVPDDALRAAAPHPREREHNEAGLGWWRCLPVAEGMQRGWDAALDLYLAAEAMGD